MLPLSLEMHGSLYTAWLNPQHSSEKSERYRKVTRPSFRAIAEKSRLDITRFKINHSRRQRGAIMNVTVLCVVELLRSIDHCARYPLH